MLTLGTLPSLPHSLITCHRHTATCLPSRVSICLLLRRRLSLIVRCRRLILRRPPCPRCLGCHQPASHTPSTSLRLRKHFLPCSTQLLCGRMTSYGQPTMQSTMQNPTSPPSAHHQPANHRPTISLPSAWHRLCAVHRQPTMQPIVSLLVPQAYFATSLRAINLASIGPLAAHHAAACGCATTSCSAAHGCSAAA